MHDFDFQPGPVCTAYHVHRATDIRCGKIVRAAIFERAQFVIQKRLRHSRLVKKIGAGSAAALGVSFQRHHPSFGNACQQLVGVSGTAQYVSQSARFSAPQSCRVTVSALHHPILQQRPEMH